MKKLFWPTLLVSLIFLGGCASPAVQQNEKTNQLTEENTSELDTLESETTAKINDDAESVDIVAKGEYEVGIDIQPGSYYAVLTEFEYKNDEYKSDKNGYVTIYQTSALQESTSSSEVSSQEAETRSYWLEAVGAKQRIKLKDGDVLEFDDNYSPISWTVQLLNNDDFKKYTEENK